MENFIFCAVWVTLRGTFIRNINAKINLKVIIICTDLSLYKIMLLQVVKNQTLYTS